MERSENKGETMLILFIGNCTLLIYGISLLIGQKKIYEEILLAFMLFFQIINTIFFIYFSSRYVRKLNSKRWIKENEVEINDHYLREIIAEMLTDEVKLESLNDYKLLKVKSLMHRAQRKTKLAKLNADKDREDIEG